MSWAVNKNNESNSDGKLPNGIFFSFIYIHKAIKQRTKMRRGKVAYLKLKKTIFVWFSSNLQTQSMAASRNASELTYWDSISCFLVPEMTVHKLWLWTVKQLIGFNFLHYSEANCWEFCRQSQGRLFCHQQAIWPLDKVFNLLGSLFPNLESWCIDIPLL